jgi:hypothetical protein
MTDDGFAFDGPTLEERELQDTIDELHQERDEAEAARDEYAAIALDLRRQLADALAIATDQAATIGRLVEQLAAAGLAAAVEPHWTTRTRLQRTGLEVAA